MKWCRFPVWLSWIAGLLVVSLFADGAVAREENLYSFDVASFSKKNWEWKGDITATGAVSKTNTNSILYDARFQGEDSEQSAEGELKIFLESRWDWEWLRLFLSGQAATIRSDDGENDEDSAFLSEGYGQLGVLDPHTLEFGKRILRWGKGYAFNPTAFMERSKNPEDPEENRVGLWLVQGIWITGSQSVFDNSSVTMVFLPIRDGINDDFRPDASVDNGWGIKTYGLINTTDIDLYLARWGEAAETDWGIDFASNLTSNFEIHGEYAAFESAENTNRKAMLGVRYLTESDVTWIVEGFHDSSGLSKEALTDLYRMIENGNPVQVKSALSRVQQRRLLSPNYAYLKISINEPFNWLYFTPSVSWLVNVSDSSYTGIIQLVYAPFENGSFRTTYQQTNGSPYTQWGESVTAGKLTFDLIYSL